MLAAMRIVLAVLVAALVAAAAYPLKQSALIDRSSWPAEDEFVLLPPPRLAPVLAIGERELWADITWVRAIAYYTATRHGESDLRYLNRFIDNILALDPRFHRVYEWAAYAVTFKQARATQEEFATSVRYLERGVREYPDDWELLWLLGQRYWLDLDGTPEQRKQYIERATELIERAMRAPGAGEELPLYAATLRSKLGQRDRAVRTLRELILTTDNPRARRKMLERFRLLTEAEGLAEELELAAKSFRERWEGELPYAPDALFVILGERPPKLMEFEDLATERDLFGTEGMSEQPGSSLAGDLGEPGQEATDDRAPRVGDAGTADEPAPDAGAD
jgi:tetratricopeptide (TPR) repeat protein